MARKSRSWRGRIKRPPWWCTVKRQPNLKILETKEYESRGGRRWKIELFENLETGRKGFLIANPELYLCLIVPTDVTKEMKVQLVEENERLPKYMKRFLEKEILPKV